MAEAGRRAPGLAPVQTAYLGGGTPSMLSPTHLKRLVHGLRDALGFSAATDLTLEANPATFGRSTAAVFRDLGVSRDFAGSPVLPPRAPADPRPRA